MNKNTFAPIPPMGWNSYDYYDTTVNEYEVKANADFMAKHLKKFGWEYIVVDIQWYAHNPGSQRELYQYIPFDGVEMDEYSRLLPCPKRFPSAANGKGFKPLADYIHSLGLKFGIHIMRGIPRIAAHNHCKILGSETTADKIANPSSICGWNPDMYGVDASREGSQSYYDSIFQLYAEWGVDYVKCDDICNTNMYIENQFSAKAEIEMLYNAIQKCCGSIALSLSPGPALIDKAWYYEKYANMWRITDDFWDNWPLLLNMFERCELWQNHVSEGCYPDCDMLTLGWLGKGFNNEHYTYLTKEEQITMMTLWCIFRSPLMLGAELTKIDDWTLSLITNEKVLHLISHSKHAKQISRDNQKAVWFSKDTEDDSYYAALFNFQEKEAEISVSLEELSFNSEVYLENLWTGELLKSENRLIVAKAGSHGAVLYRITCCNVAPIH